MLYRTIDDRILTIKDNFNILDDSDSSIITKIESNSNNPISQVIAFELTRLLVQLNFNFET